MAIELPGLFFPEALRWHEGSLWFSDMFDSRVVRWTPGRDAETVIDRTSGCPAMPGGLGWLLPEVDPQGRGALLVVDCLERRILALRHGELSVHAELGDFFDLPANDLHVDPDGTAWVGGYGFDPETDEPRSSPLLRVAPDGRVTETSTRFVFPNGCERDAGGALVVAETFADRLTSIRHPSPGNTAEESSLVAEFPSGSGPDGISIGPDGTTYVALAFAGRVVALDGGRTGALHTLYSPEPVLAGPGAGPLACYDCAVEPGGRRIAVAIASADEALAVRTATGRIVLLELRRPGSSRASRSARTLPAARP